jgi:hypothetical protein
VLGAAPTLGLVGWHVLRNSKEGTAAPTLPTVGFPSTPTAMLAVVDDQQLVTALAVLVLAPGTAKGGTLIAFPTNSTTAQTAEEQQVPVADSVINNGPDFIADDVVSLSRVSIGSSGVLDEAGLATLLAPLPSVTVTLPADVIDAAADGTTQTVLPAGEQQLTPAQMASALVADDPSQVERTRLPNVHAVWLALASAVGTGINPTAVSVLGPDGPVDFNDFMAHFLAGPIQVFNDLATVPITGPTNPDNVDVGRLDVPSVVMLMAGLAPSAMITPKPTLNFRIENGLTQADIDAAGLTDLTPVDVTLDLVRRLLFAEGNVLSVSSEVATLGSKQAPDVTTIFAEGALQSEELAVISKQLGQVKTDDPKFQYPLVNVVIVVGRSYLTDISERQAVLATAVTVTNSTDVTGTGTLDSGAPDGTADPGASASTVSS